MLINMFELAFKGFFKTPHDLQFAKTLWSTILRLLQSWGPGMNERFEAWEYYNNWIGIAQAVFEKGSPKAQVCMLEAWNDYVYLSTEFPLALGSAKLSDLTTQTKSIVTLTRPLRLLSSPHLAVVEQAQECCTHVIYSCLNPAFANSFSHTVELDVFWTDVVETCIRLLVKDGLFSESRRLHLLTTLATLFNPRQSASTPTTSITSSPTKQKNRWTAARLLDEHIGISEIPALPAAWVRSKSHIIINALLNTVLPNLSKEPWTEVWYNFVTLSCQQMYREQRSSSKLSEDSYNILRTVMNGTVQILDQHDSLASQNTNALLLFLVDICEPIISQLLQENMIFSVSANGPYIVRCASSIASLPENNSSDTFNLNPVILLWTIIMKFSQNLPDSSNSSGEDLAYMKLLNILLPTATKQLAADITTVLVTMIYKQNFKIEPLWKYIYDNTGVSDIQGACTQSEEVLVNNMIRLHMFINPSCEPDSTIHDWGNLLSISTKSFYASSKMKNFMGDVVKIYCEDVMSRYSLIETHREILFHFMTSLLKVNAMKKALWENLNDNPDDWQPFFKLVASLMKATKITHIAHDAQALVGFMEDLEKNVETIATIPNDLMDEFLSFSTSEDSDAHARRVLTAYITNLKCFSKTVEACDIHWLPAEVEFLKKCLQLPVGNFARQEAISALTTFVRCHGQDLVASDLQATPGFPSGISKKRVTKQSQKKRKGSPKARSVPRIETRVSLEIVDGVSQVKVSDEEDVEMAVQNAATRSIELSEQSIEKVVANVSSDNIPEQMEEKTQLSTNVMQTIQDPISSDAQNKDMERPEGSNVSIGDDGKELEVQFKESDTDTQLVQSDIDMEQDTQPVDSIVPGEPDIVSPDTQIISPRESMVTPTKASKEVALRPEDSPVDEEERHALFSPIDKETTSIDLTVKRPRGRPRQSKKKSKYGSLSDSPAITRSTTPTSQEKVEECEETTAISIVAASASTPTRTRSSAIRQSSTSSPSDRMLRSRPSTPQLKELPPKNVPRVKKTSPEKKVSPAKKAISAKKGLTKKSTPIKSPNSQQRKTASEITGTPKANPDAKAWRSMPLMTRSLTKRLSNTNVVVIDDEMNSDTDSDEDADGITAINVGKEVATLDKVKKVEVDSEVKEVEVVSEAKEVEVISEVKEVEVVNEIKKVEANKATVDEAAKLVEEIKEEKEGEVSQEKVKELIEGHMETTENHEISATPADEGSNITENGIPEESCVAIEVLPTPQNTEMEAVTEPEPEKPNVNIREECDIKDEADHDSIIAIDSNSPEVSVKKDVLMQPEDHSNKRKRQDEEEEKDSIQGCEESNGAALVRVSKKARGDTCSSCVLVNAVKDELVLPTMEKSTNDLLSALESYTKTVAEGSKPANPDRSRVFELETKLMQALIQTRSLVME